jgi:N-acetylneuraminic acid mutarotase
MHAARLAMGAAVALVAGGTAVVLAASGGPESARSDRWTALRPAGLERTEVAAARIGRSIYVVGGFERSSGVSTAAVERYDIRRNRWSRVRPMPLALNHATAVAYRGDLYVHGGYRGANNLTEPTGALLRFDPERRRWRRLPASSAPRAAHAVAVIGNRLYAAGGANDTGSLRSLEIYDFERRRWTSGPNFSFGPARNHTTGVAAGGRFYVIAGRDAENFTAVERYDPRRRRWEDVPDLRTPRGGIASARLADGRIVVFGGENLVPGGTTIREVELFDPRARRWRSLPTMRTPRHGLGGVALGQRVYALQGGVEPGFSFSDAIEVLDVRRRAAR